LPTGNSSEALRILVVDDEPAILFAYRKLIEMDGMAVDTSANLEDAIRHVRACSYLAVIADMRLTGSDNRDGLEILRLNWKERPGTHTILATGYGDSEIENMARNLGVSYYFKKPVSPSDRLNTLRGFHT
jgi:DNA-binding NtrC family response regulator